MVDTTAMDDPAAAWRMPNRLGGAIIGAVVVLAFTIAHNVYIADIWFNVGPMLVSGALCGMFIVWSYASGTARHSTKAWFGYAGLLSAEMIALGAVSLVVLEPQFTMAELIVRDDAIDVLMPPSMPLMIAAMALGTAAFWLFFGRRAAALLPILVTQVLVVFLLGHQFAFLGLVESSTTLLRTFAEFALITVVLAAAFSAGVMGATIGLERFKRPSGPGQTDRERRGVDSEM